MNPVAEFLQSEEGRKFLIRLLEDNLTLHVNVTGGDYGSSQFLEVEVKFNNEVVAVDNCYIS